MQPLITITKHIITHTTLHRHTTHHYSSPPSGLDYTTRPKVGRISGIPEIFGKVGKSNSGGVKMGSRIP
jgi:hypothetical protein